MKLEHLSAKNLSKQKTDTSGSLRALHNTVSGSSSACRSSWIWDSLSPADWSDLGSICRVATFLRFVVTILSDCDLLKSSKKILHLKVKKILTLDFVYVKLSRYTGLIDLNILGYNIRVDF